MEPFFFGPPGEQLFAVFHRACGPVCRGAVLLCGPPAPDAVRFHRPLRRIAEGLAARGLSVLRFDLRGCGDSAGLFEACSLEHWREDTRRAAGALLARSGPVPLALLGLRLGASLAALLASELSRVAVLVLWDPVSHGARWWAALEREHARMLQVAHVSPPPVADTSTRELLGFAWGARLQAELRALDLTRLSVPRAAVFLLETDPGQPLDKLAARWHAGRAELCFERSPDPELWCWHESFRGATPQPALLARILEWLSARLAEVATAATARPVGKGSEAAPRALEAGGEEICVFADAGPLVGILHKPAQQPLSAPGFVFLDSSLAPRVGHYRLYVKLARALSARGFPVLRFDFSGVGDSPARPDGRPADEAHIAETQAAMQRLAALGCRRFVLLGVCAGGRQAYRTALEDPRVAGLVLINVRAHLHERPAAGLRLRALLRHGLRMTLASSFAARTRGHLAAGRADSSRVLDLLRRLRPNDLLPRWRERASGLQQLLSQGTVVLQLHAEADEGVDYLAAALGPERSGVMARAGFEFESISGSNHTFTLLWSQKRLIASVVGWACARFSAEDLP